MRLDRPRSWANMYLAFDRPAESAARNRRSRSGAKGVHGDSAGVSAGTEDLAGEPAGMRAAADDGGAVDDDVVDALGVGVDAIGLVGAGQVVAQIGGAAAYGGSVEDDQVGM